LLVVLGGLALWGTVALAGAVAPGWAAERMPARGAPGLLSRFGPAHRLLLGVSIVAVGPAVEEFVFRGLLLRRWVATRGLWPGVLGSAAVFALLHPPMWVGSFVFGVALGLLYLGSRSLVPSVLAHILHNGLVVATALGPTRSRRPRRPRGRSQRRKRSGRSRPRGSWSWARWSPHSRARSCGGRVWDSTPPNVALQPTKPRSDPQQGRAPTARLCN
jgi:hypothetical protein